MCITIIFIRPIMFYFTPCIHIFTRFVIININAAKTIESAAGTENSVVNCQVS